MPRPKGDHEARRDDVSEAVWRVLSAHGFNGLTMRAVAAELGATTGLLTHYFPSKRDLVGYALDLLDRRSAARERRPAVPGMGVVRASLLDMLPLTPETVTGNRIWLSSWDAALADPAANAAHAGRYARSRERLCAQIAAAQRLGELRPGDPMTFAAGVQAFVLGLAAQAVFDPAAFPPDRQIELLDEQLSALAPS